MAIIVSDTRFVQFIISRMHVNLMSDQKYAHNILIVDRKHWLKLIFGNIGSWSRLWSKVGSLNFDDGGDTMMSSDAIYYSDDFGQLNLPLTTVDFSFGQSSYRFLYRQNKLESIGTVNVTNVTTCFTRLYILVPWNYCDFELQIEIENVCLSEHR